MGNLYEMAQPPPHDRRNRLRLHGASHPSHLRLPRQRLPRCHRGKRLLLQLLETQPPQAVPLPSNLPPVHVAARRVPARQHRTRLDTHHRHPAQPDFLRCHLAVLLPTAPSYTRQALPLRSFLVLLRRDYAHLGRCPLWQSPHLLHPSPHRLAPVLRRNAKGKYLCMAHHPHRPRHSCS